MKESLEKPSAAKVVILVQAYVSQLNPEGLSLNSDTVFISLSVGALLRAISEIAL